MKRAALAPVVTLVAVTLLAASSSFAQSSNTTAGGRPEERRTTINMDEDVIEGALNVPDHQIVPAHGRRAFRSLIQIRKEFRREVLASADRL
jgi:hypothetical protein